MNVDTGHVVLQDELETLPAEQRERYVKVPPHMAQEALAAHKTGDSLFSGKHGGQRIKSQAHNLARKRKAKLRRAKTKASRRKNRCSH